MRSMFSDDSDILQEIQYHGRAGISQSCKDAIARLIHFGDSIGNVRLLTNEGQHGFLLTINDDDLIAVKCGFRSGYAGEGPNALAVSLQLLRRHGADIGEYIVSPKIITRINGSALTVNDIRSIESSAPVRPRRWHDYIWENAAGRSGDAERLQREFPEAMPFRLIDPRLVDLALEFPNDPDKANLSAYRRLEDLVRDRTGISGEHSAKLFAKAFQGENAPLKWSGIEASEQQGRVSLFTGTYMAFRNRRAHREPESSHNGALQEFLLINQLYKLEAEAIENSAR